MLLFQFLEVGSGWYWVNFFYQTCLECDFRLIWRQQQKKSALGSPKVGGGGPQIGTQSQMFLFFW